MEQDAGAILSGRDLDFWLATHVTKLREPGYYRRASCKSGVLEKCEKGDVTPDSPQWTADLYYKVSKSSDFLHVIPYYSGDLNEAWCLVETVRKRAWAVSLQSMYLLGKWIYCASVVGPPHPVMSSMVELASYESQTPAQAIATAVCLAWEKTKKDYDSYGHPVAGYGT